MKGNQEIIDALNARLVEELTAINQYSVHRAKVGNWEYNGLTAYIQERLDDETRHFNLLLDRILFLEGTPVVGRLNQVLVGESVEEMHQVDLSAEENAVRVYNETIELCRALKDDDTRRLLESILADEIDHLHDLEAQLKQIEQMTIANYLSAKL